MIMKATPQVTVRMPDGLEDAARSGATRSGHADLAQAPVSVLIRAGLAALAGWDLSEVLPRLASKTGARREPWKVGNPPNGNSI